MTRPFFYRNLKSPPNNVKHWLSYHLYSCIFWFIHVRLVDFRKNQVNNYKKFLNRYFQYSISTRKRAWAGAEAPAAPLSFISIIFQKSSADSFPFPTSSKVPTIARTILRKKRSALILKINLSPSAAHSD